jgi:hypothetical protein
MRHLETVGLAVGAAAALFGLFVSGNGHTPAYVTVRPGQSGEPEPPDSPHRDRFAFVKQLSRVKEGMARPEVRRLLGEPDDRRTGNEVNASDEGFYNRGGNEVWGYGGNGHLTFPTLGTVSFDKHGKVLAVLGQAGSEPGEGSHFPSRDLPSEPDTRRILRLIHGLRSYDHRNDPLRVIQVVNALQPLGKAGALAVMNEYVRVADYPLSGRGREGLFVVIRCLFEVPQPPGYIETMAVGAPNPELPKDPRRSPRFPVVLYHDVPFSGINGYMLAGMPEPVEWELDGFCRTATMRAQPLRPPDNPLELIDGLVRSPEWPKWENPAWGKTDAREQALRLVDSVYRVEEDDSDERLTGYYTDQEPQWREHVRRFAAIHAHWDPAQNCYVSPDGSFLPPRPDRVWVPQSWRSKTPAGEVDVTLQRRHRTSVDIEMASRGAKPPMPLLRIFVDGKEIKTGWDQHVPAKGGSGTGFRAPEGSDIRLVLERDGKTIAETTLRP